MLRVEIRHSAETLTVRLEGRFAGDDAEHTRTLAARFARGKLLVDLTEVVFIDALGEEVLSFLASSGAEFVAPNSYLLDACERLNLRVAPKRSSHLSALGGPVPQTATILVLRDPSLGKGKLHRSLNMPSTEKLDTHRKAPRSIYRSFALLLAVSLLGYMVFRAGPGTVWKQVQAVGWGLALIVTLGGFSQLIKTCAWRQTLACNISTLSWSRSLWSAAGL